MSRPEFMMHGSPEDIESAYYDALARADLDGLMALWADDEDIVCVHPGAQRLIGYDAIRTVWQDILSRGSLLIHPQQLHVIHSLGTAIHNIIEHIHHSAGEQPDVHVIATNIYIKTTKGWRIVLHHASVAPGPAPLNVTAGAMLH